MKSQSQTPTTHETISSSEPIDIQPVTVNRESSTILAIVILITALLKSVTSLIQVILQGQSQHSR